MISLSARTHIALGLAAIVTTGLLLGVFFGLLPDRIGACLLYTSDAADE